MRLTVSLSIQNIAYNTRATMYGFGALSNCIKTLSGLNYHYLRSFFYYWVRTLFDYVISFTCIKSWLTIDDSAYICWVSANIISTSFNRIKFLAGFNYCHSNPFSFCIKRIQCIFPFQQKRGLVRLAPLIFLFVYILNINKIFDSTFQCFSNLKKIIDCR